MKKAKMVFLTVLTTLTVLFGLFWFIMGSKVNISTENDIADNVEIDTAMLPDIIPLSNDFIRNISQANDSIHFIHLWASWCKPCIEEMPAIVALVIILIGWY